MKLLNLYILAIFFSLLAACGGGDDGYGGDTGGGNQGGDEPTPEGEGTTPPVQIDVGSVTISYPYSNAIVDNENGTYSRKFSVLVRDTNGLPAPNGVRVDLQVVDTILAFGSLSDSFPTDSAIGTLLTVPNTLQTDDTPNNRADNPVVQTTTAYVTRPGLDGGSIRQIMANDLVIMPGPHEQVPSVGAASGFVTGHVDSRDVVRSIASAPTIADQLVVSDTYNINYPSSAVDNYYTNYYVMASMIGAGVSGEDASGVPTQGHTVTKGGLGTAVVWVTYPSNINYIHSGDQCAPHELDDRVSPMGSSQPMLVATSNGISNTQSFCFSSIAGYQLESTPDSWSVPSGGTSNVDFTICTIDGGDGVPLPYQLIGGVYQSAGTATVTNITYSDGTPTITTPSGDLYYTRGDGCFNVTMDVTGASGNSATVQALIGDGTHDMSIQVR